MTVLTKAAFLAANDRPLHEIEVPELGGSVFVRPMSAAEAEAFDGEDTTVTKLVAAYVVDGEGRKMFEESDIPLLQEKSFKALDTIARGVLQANGLGDVEQVEKN